MKFLKRRMTRFILAPMFTAIGLVTCFNSFYYKTGPLSAFRIFFDSTTGRLGQGLRLDGVGPAVELELRDAGYGQLAEPATGRLLKLSHVTKAGQALDGAPIFHAFYKSTWHGARLVAYFSNGKIHLFDFCDGANFNCKYLRPDQLPKLASEKDSQEKSLNLDETSPTSLKTAENQAFLTRENHRPGVQPAVPVNRAPVEKTFLSKSAVLRESISEQKKRTVQVSMYAPETAAKDPFEQITTPAFAQPWLGKWAGDFMSLNISFSGGKFRVGKSEAKLNGSELVFLKEGTFGRIVWVKLNFSDGLIFAKEENQYGETIQTAVLKK